MLNLSLIDPPSLTGFNLRAARCFLCDSDAEPAQLLRTHCTFSGDKGCTYCHQCFFSEWSSTCFAVDDATGVTSWRCVRCDTWLLANECELVQ